MEERQRNSTGFLIKQRAFLKLYLIRQIEARKNYGKQMLDELKATYKPYGYKPQHPEIYRALHELYEDGILQKRTIPKEGTNYQNIEIYSIADQELANAYKKLVKADLDRSSNIIKQALQDNFS